MFPFYCIDSSGVTEEPGPREHPVGCSPRPAAVMAGNPGCCGEAPIRKCPDSAELPRCGPQDRLKGGPPPAKTFNQMGHGTKQRRRARTRGAGLNDGRGGTIDRRQKKSSSSNAIYRHKPRGPIRPIKSAIGNNRHTTVRLLTWNVDGFNSPPQRLSICSFLWKHKVDIAILTETHLLDSDIFRVSPITGDRIILIQLDH